MYTREQQLKHLAETARRLQSAADAEDWDAVSELNGQLHLVSREIFANPPGPEEVAAVTAAVKSSLEFIRQAMMHSNEARTTHMNTLVKISNGRQVVQKYSANSR